MIIIAYSETTAATIEQRIGRADYSYYFIYKKYLPALEKLGRLIAVEDPAAEVDRIYRDNPDEDCVFLSFTPPHKTCLHLECPTVCVFAWEFSSIPDEAWDDTPENNWVNVLQQIGNALTISEYAASVARNSLPQDFNVLSIPAAIDTAALNKLKAKPERTVISAEATLYDSDCYELSPDMVDDAVKGTRDPLKLTQWDDQPISLSFTPADPLAIELLVGFYDTEPWGTWSRTTAPSIMLPHRVKGAVIIELELAAYGANVARDIQVQLGSERKTIQLRREACTYRLEFTPEEPTDLLKFHNLDVRRDADSQDSRTLGLGAISMSVMRPEHYAFGRVRVPFSPLRKLLNAIARKFATLTAQRSSTLELKGIVYTTVMNPLDGRKNWEDIVTAFCWAFRETEDATLVLKMTTHNHLTFLGRLLMLYARLSPFKCRVVAIHGYLDDKQYQALVDGTHYVVNCSAGEGQCFPLSEFMGQGVPAVAPDHTAMGEYISSDNAFIIQSNQYPMFWPLDFRRKAIRTRCRSMHWSSLRDAYLQSYEVARYQPATYETMRVRSIEAIAASAGEDVVYQKLRQYLPSAAKRYRKV